MNVKQVEKRTVLLVRTDEPVRALYLRENSRKWKKAVGESWEIADDMELEPAYQAFAKERLAIWDEQILLNFLWPYEQT